MLYGARTPRSPSIGTYGCFPNTTLGQNYTTMSTGDILTSASYFKMNTTDTPLKYAVLNHFLIIYTILRNTCFVCFMLGVEFCDVGAFYVRLR